MTLKTWDIQPKALYRVQMKLNNFCQMEMQKKTKTKQRINIYEIYTLHQVESKKKI